jgi:uncharacterized membrane protein
MKHITATFFKGLFTLLPLLLSLYVFIWFLTWLESSARSLVFLPDFMYIPGMGVAVAFLLIYVFGMVVDRPLAKWIFTMIESLFAEMPVVKTVYLAVKDFTEFLKPNASRRGNQVVLVKLPDAQVEMVGLLTRDSLSDLPFGAGREDGVAVYFPMSYQFGGATLFVPRAWVTPVNMGVEQAMRSIITAWVPGRDKKLEKQL